MFGAKSRLRQNSRAIPLRFEFQQVSDEKLTPAQIEYLKPIDAQLEAINYRPMCTFRATNYGNNLLRRYAHPTDPASCALTVVEVKVNVNGVQGVKNASSVEFTTRLANGKRFTTRNMAQKSLFDQPPYKIVQECPNVTNLAELKRKHDAGAQSLGVPVAASQTIDGIFEDVQAEHQRYSSYQVEVGNYRMSPDGSAYILADKVFSRGIRNHFLPFGQRISLAHTLFSALIGAVFTLFGVLKVAPWLATTPYEHAVGVLPASLVGIGVCYLLAGVIVGGLCDVQKFTWFMLITYVPAHLVAGWSFGWFPYTTMAFNASFFVAQALRRRALVLQT
jgi:hypothetical protein